MIIPEAETSDAMDEAEDSSALDRSRLAELAGDEGDFEAELLEVFLTSAAGDVARLIAAIERGDAAELVRTAHGLKGASVQIGALGLAAVARELEFTGSQVGPGRLAELLVTIEREIARVRRAATAVLGERAFAIAV